jgi:hypothetical protein
VFQTPVRVKEQCSAFILAAAVPDWASARAQQISWIAGGNGGNAQPRTASRTRSVGLKSCGCCGVVSRRESGDAP